MSLGTAIWNFTEYLCYLCIIISTGLALLSFFKVGGGNAETGDSWKSMLAQALGKAQALADQISSDDDSKKKKSSPATAIRRK